MLLDPETTNDSFFDFLSALIASSAAALADEFKSEETPAFPPKPLMMYAKTAACSEGLIIPR